MDVDFLINAFQQYGYIALILIFWIGIIAFPLPNEAIIMSGGFISTLDIFAPIPTFFATYLGVVLGFSTRYFIGRAIGAPTIDYLAKKKKLIKYINKTQKLVDRYGSMSVVICYTIPIVRIIVPHIVGMNKMPYPKYALFSYTAGLVWTTFYFLLGKYFGNSLDNIDSIYVKYMWVIIVVLAIIVYFRSVIVGFIKRSYSRIFKHVAVKDSKVDSVDSKNNF